MGDFVSGLVLCRDFYRDVLEHRLAAGHAAALLGPGSDVLGYDDERSTDHDWGPRCQIFVPPDDVADVRDAVARSLPDTYRGWSVAIGRDGEEPRPQVVVDTLDHWLSAELGWKVAANHEFTHQDWLVIPQTRLLGITQGAVFADPQGDLERLRRRLAWYPEPVWWWLLACQWRRLAQEEPFVQRTAEAGDDLGSRIVGGRLVRDCIRLAMLMARAYAPYGKWLGTSFCRLDDPDGLGAALSAAMAADTGGDRERALGEAYRLLATRFNGLAPDLGLGTQLRSFHDRPTQVLGADRFAQAALERVTDARLSHLPLVGGVDQLIDVTDVLAEPRLASRSRSFYESLEGHLGHSPGR